jgi:hypothetical protein
MTSKVEATADNYLLISTHLSFEVDATEEDLNFVVSKINMWQSDSLQRFKLCRF